MHRYWHSTQRAFMLTGVLMACSLLITLPAYVLDVRMFDGANVWLKPIKFQVALAVYFLSLVFFCRWVPDSLLNSRKFRIYAIVVSLTATAEMIWIGGAAAAGVGSHYNDNTLFMAVIYPVMGIFAVTLTTASFVIGRAILDNRNSGLDPALQLSIGLALMLTCVLTIISAGTLSALPGHFIGVPTDGATIPIMGWSREVGDLRVAHFFSTHAMHILPLAGLVILLLSPRWRRPMVLFSAFAFTGFVGFLYILALTGHPFISIG